MPVARYEQIAADLRTRILAGDFAAGERLPPQRDLATSWKTTLPTVRQALDQLQRDGFLEVQHGVGTFVADIAAAADPFAVSSFTELLRERGLQAETRLLAVDSQAQSPAATAALALTEQDGLVLLTRLRVIDTTPVLYQRSYLAGQHRTVLAQYDGTRPLYAFLRDRLSLVTVTYREVLTAEVAPAEVTEALDLDSGTPVIVARRTSATVEGYPLVYDEAYLPSSRVHIVVTRQGHHGGINLMPVLGHESAHHPLDDESSQPSGSARDRCYER